MRRWLSINQMYFGIALGMVLLGLGTSYFMSAILLVPSNAALVKLRQNTDVTETQLGQFINDHKAAALWLDNGATYTNLALAYLRIARLKGFKTSNGRRYLMQARQELRKGLSMAPANPYAWSRLAFVELALDGRNEMVANALAMSIRTGKYERRLRYSRAILALRVWNKFDASDLKLMSEYLSEIWQTNKWDFAQAALLANKVGLAENIIGLKGADLALFRRYVRQHRELKAS